MIGWRRIAFLVEEDVGIFVFLKFELPFKSFIVTAETILLYSLYIDLLDVLVIETIPLVL